MHTTICLQCNIQEYCIMHHYLCWMISIHSKLYLWFNVGRKIEFQWFYLQIKLAGFIKFFFLHKFFRAFQRWNLTWISVHAALSAQTHFEFTTNIWMNSRMKLLNFRGHRPWLLWRNIDQYLWMEYLEGFFSNVLERSRLHTAISVGQRSLGPIKQI